MQSAQHILTSLLGLASIGVWAVVAGRFFSRVPVIESAPRKTSYPVLPVVIAVALMAVLIGAAARDAAAGEPDPMLFEENVVVLSLAVELVAIGFLWLVVGLTTPTRSGWGIRKDHLLKQIGIGLGGAAFAFLPTIGMGLMTQYLGQEQQAIQVLRQSESLTHWVLVAASAVIVAPLLEEMMFRVVLQGYLTEKFEIWPAVFWTAMFFAAIHGWPAMLGLVPFALTIGYIYQKTGSVLSTVTMHMAFNGSMIAVLALEVLAERAGQ